MSDTDTRDEIEEVSTLQPVNFCLVEAEKTIARLDPDLVDSRTFSGNTQFLNHTYMGEVAQFVHPWKKDTIVSFDAEAKDNLEEGKESKDSKEEAKGVNDIVIPDTLIYVEVVPELSAKAKRKLAIAKLSDRKNASSSSDSDSDKSSSTSPSRSRRKDGERKSIRFSDDYDDSRHSYRDSYHDSDSKSDRRFSDDKDDSYK